MLLVKGLETGWSWVRVALTAVTGVLIRRGHRVAGEEAETRVMRPRAQEHRGHWQLGETRQDPPLQPSEAARPCRHLDLGLRPPGPGEKNCCLQPPSRGRCYSSPGTLTHRVSPPTSLSQLTAGQGRRVWRAGVPILLRASQGLGRGCSWPTGPVAVTGKRKLQRPGASGAPPAPRLLPFTLIPFAASSREPAWLQMS